MNSRQHILYVGCILVILVVYDRIGIPSAELRGHLGRRAAGLCHAPGSHLSQTLLKISHQDSTSKIVLLEP